MNEGKREGGVEGEKERVPLKQTMMRHLVRTGKRGSEVLCGSTFVLPNQLLFALSLPFCCPPTYPVNSRRGPVSSSRRSLTPPTDFFPEEGEEREGEEERGCEGL